MIYNVPIVDNYMLDTYWLDFKIYYDLNELMFGSPKFKYNYITYDLWK